MNMIGITLTYASRFLFLHIKSDTIFSYTYLRLWTKDMCRRPQRLCEMRHFYFDGERERLKDKTIKDG